MAVNTAALKTFAPAMRRQLLEAVGRKLDLLLHSQTPDTLSTYAKQIAELREQEAENREQLLERVAYTWFNRLCALRYLDARGWHPFGCKVLMPAAEGETQPELLKLMRAGNLPAGLQGHTDESRLHGLLDGQIQRAIAGADPQGEVYRDLVLATCRFYHEQLPNLFEAIDDATELLLPDDLLTEGSIAGAFRSEISDGDCANVEIIGWLYQFYISEKKDAVMARKKAVPAEDIPAVTQLFTPHWIVRYLVENSLGRLWLLNRPGSKLREQMPYYIEGYTETDFLVINRPEEIKLLDPACGSGHMLTYAFDLLALIYEEEGYAPSEIPGLILQHNLHGLEICPRAAQLSELALVFKARERSRRFFQPEQHARTQIVELEDHRFDDSELNDYIEALGLREFFDLNLFKLLGQFQEAKNFGSLIQPCLVAETIDALRRIIEAKAPGGQLFLLDTHFKLLRMLKQAEVLAQRYHVVVANPPYMGSGNFNSQLRAGLEGRFKVTRTDLYAIFFERGIDFLVPNGFLAMVMMQGWMFTTSYRALREKILSCYQLNSLAQLGPRAFDSISGEVVSTAMLSLVRTSPTGKRATFIRITEGDAKEKEEDLLRGNSRYKFDQRQFCRIQGSPMIYWKGLQLIKIFEAFPAIGELASFREGIHTGDNEAFVRRWWEVSQAKFSTSEASAATIDAGAAKWLPYNKGGDFTRWYGNNLFVIAFDAEARERMSSLKGHVRPSQGLYFRAGGTWSDIGSSGLGMKYYPSGYLFADVGPAMVAGKNLLSLIAAVNSVAFGYLCELLMPSIHYKCGTVKRVPFPPDFNKDRVEEIGRDCIGLARDDWDNREISWDFRGHLLLRLRQDARTLEASWRNWEVQSRGAVQRMQDLEAENNRLFISAYGLDGELQPEVPEEKIMLARAVASSDVAAILSYATGCMMGRYSLDQPGLILADSRTSQAEHLSAYEERVGKPQSKVQFKPDPDGIIPVLDGEWFEDDIVARAREFLTVTFPESSVAENLRFIEESLGKDIRKYFCSEFYKDHLQNYKKRPIYWMVQSPKKGFSCLIYLHRYTKDTLNQVLNNYFRPYLQKLEARLAQLGLDQLNDDLPARERTAARKEAEKITKVLKECQAWEQDALLPLAQQRIELDLDDGVKVNYLKLQDVLAPIPGLAAKED